ncbi:type IV pilus biogenesis protein PilM [Pectobacterium carotovorum]|uniref:type IV pilus biogenesis protein PilM n=1 Tax=Pectobacterium carotovorum TaxID=554 RepID=UPI001938E195|nr:type IV pilus biogenesis protein PilM [Pectobacterium versatile]
MGWVILAISLIFFIISGDIDLQERHSVETSTQNQVGQVYASQILMIANQVNDYRYHTELRDGTVSYHLLSLPFEPDARIQHQLQQGRLWVWMPEQPGLIEALRHRSRGSAMIGILQGGQLTWVSGVATGLTAPQGIPNGAVVYLN